MLFSIIYKKFRFAQKGLVYIIRRERSFRWELVAGTVALFLAWYFSLSSLGWSILILVITLVLSAEVLNTVLERILDIIEPRLAVHVAVLKDLLASAVFILVLGALAIAVLLWSSA